MAHNHMISAAPSDPYQWRESVLSTRSLSYLSNADALESRGPSRNPSSFFPGAHAHMTPTRKNTLTSMSDISEGEVLEMRSRLAADAVAEASPEPQLPSSVAHCPLFHLPRELREVVYAHVLSSHLGIQFPSTKQDRQIHPELLRTCRLIYAETAPLLYAANKLIFSHPSDANMFRHALASDSSSALGTIIFRVKKDDTRLWTSYFNSTSDERSLVRDFPDVRHLTIRFRGLRYQPLASQEQNAAHWLKDAKLQEIIVSVRKCVPHGTVKVELCVRVPDGWLPASWHWAAVRAAVDQEEGRQHELRKQDYLWIHGVWMRLETEGT